MSENNTSFLVVGIILVVLITAGLTYYITKSNGSPFPGLQNQSNQSTGTPTITVRGDASRTVPPNLLTLGITVEGNGSTVADSQTDAAAKVAALKAALLAKGVQESDIQTTSYYTTPVYNDSCNYCYPMPVYYGTTSGASDGSTPSVDVGAPAPPPVPSNGMMPYRPYCDTVKCTAIGYSTTHMVTIQSSSVNDGGSLVDASLAVNGTKFDYVYFSLNDSSRISIESDLESEAAAAAQSKAEKIAQGLGARLGKVVSVNPDQSYPYPVYAAGGGVAVPQKDTNSAPPTQLFPSDTTLSSSIVVVYELQQ